MSLVTGTARTGEAAAVAEAPLFNGIPLILGTIAINTFYIGVRIYEQVFGQFAGLAAMLMTVPKPISNARAPRLHRSTVHHQRATGLWSMRANIIGKAPRAIPRRGGGSPVRALCERRDRPP